MPFFFALKIREGRNIPLENWHSCRLLDPAKFDGFAQKACAEKHDGKCITHNYGLYDDEDKASELQALRYKTTVWTEASAKSHCKSKDGTFEPASDEEDSLKNKGVTMAVKRTNKRSPFKPQAKGNYRVENKTDKEATIYIYDEIGWFGVEATDFVKDLNDIKAETIHVRLNTPGGNVFDGTAIANAIKQHKSKTVVHIDGLAASIGSIIAIAGDETIMADNAFFMFHEAWSFVIGNAEGLREEAELLDKIDGVLAKAYANKTGKKQDEIKELMNAETWLTAEEALEMGMIDGIEEDKEEKASAAIFDLSVFANVPDALKDIKKDLNERDLERALRDAGCSRNQAKEILAKGFKGDPNQRDVEEEARLKTEREAQLEEETRLREAEKAKKVKPGSTEDLLMQAEIMAPTQ